MCTCVCISVLAGKAVSSQPVAEALGRPPQSLGMLGCLNVGAHRIAVFHVQSTSLPA